MGCGGSGCRGRDARRTRAVGADRVSCGACTECQRGGESTAFPPELRSHSRPPRAMADLVGDTTPLPGYDRVQQRHQGLWGRDMCRMAGVEFVIVPVFSPGARGERVEGIPRAEA